MRRDEASLLDIASAASLVLEFKEGMDKAAFLEDVKTQSSVLPHPDTLYLDSVGGQDPAESKRVSLSATP